MLTKLIARGGLLLVLVVSIWHYTSFNPLLPDTVAVHFDGSGKPNGWQSRSSFWVVYFALIYGIWLFIAVIGWLMRLLPDGLINIPHKDYWLAPERRQQTLAKLSIGLELFATIQALWMLWLFDSIIRLNLSEPQLGSLFIIQMVVYLVSLVVWIFWYVVGYYRPNRVL